MVEAAAHRGQQRAFQVVGRGQRGMAAFAGQCHPAATAVGHHRPHAQAGARAHHRQRPAGRARHAGVGAHLFRAQPGQRQGERLKVIQHQQVLQPQRRLHRAARKIPVAVGEADPVARHGRGHRKGCMARRTPVAAGGRLQASQIGLGRLGGAGKVGHGQLAHMRHRRARRRHPAEPGIGAPDVGHQTRVAGGGGRGAGCTRVACGEGRHGQWMWVARPAPRQAGHGHTEASRGPARTADSRLGRGSETTRTRRENPSGDPSGGCHGITPSGRFPGKTDGNRPVRPLPMHVVQLHIVQYSTAIHGPAGAPVPAHRQLLCTAWRLTTPRA